ncbi:ABC transporter substrate-binding protein [Streptomyces antimycoticus]|uniref:Sugar ABC transporter substrate-binding protein n=1 Tax=Streptomyces antimycoticus TaxID=68175 RepID=A0A4D4K7G1_9ACTN|nr:ABC transporter substrate-binding protein [Streptomyces antimycoticus]GDY42900.1 sugar ABC transporter substrate-binding protein [Streptomyces antimycoticus]
MRRNRTKASCALALVLTLGGTLTGCGGDGGGGSGGKVSLRFTWWGNPDRAARTEEAVGLFEKHHPDIDISTSFAGFDTYKAKLATQAAGGDAPDVMQLDYRQINQYATSGILLNLGKHPELRTSEIDKGLLATGVVDGKQYALPVARGTETMAYDATLWRKAGVPEPTLTWTWNDWADAMRKLAASPATKGRVGSTDPGQSEDVFEIWLRSRGKSLYTKDEKLGFTADDLTRYWEWCTGLRKEGAVSSAEQTTQMDGTVENTPLGRLKSVADFNWDAPVSGYSAIVGEGLKLAPFPVGEDGTPGQYFKPSMFFGASAKTGHPKQAAQFIDFLLNDKEAGAILGASRGIPANDTIRQGVLPKLEGFDQVISTYQKQFEGKLNDPPPAPPKGDTSLQSTFSRDYDQVSYERLSPREAAENYITEAKAELRQ